MDIIDLAEYGVIVENTAPKVAFTLLEMLIGKEKTDEVRVAMGYK